MASEYTGGEVKHAAHAELEEASHATIARASRIRADP